MPVMMTNTASLEEQVLTIAQTLEELMKSMHEGARELLEEVVSKADGPLKSRAQTMLDALG